MRPRKDDESLVDVLDVLLRDGAILRADVIVSVAEVPLVGIKLTAAIAGMETMNEYGLFEDWDAHRRKAAAGRRLYYDSAPDSEHEGVTELGVGSARDDRPGRDETD
ncbi:gas vesicle protein GvpM [Natrinema pallidum]|uniref:Gas vesicle protein GvpA n=2 Tax=Natrinema pallidum TaxID=69527 RepID=L9Z062_9EURY|nr:gas vesicle protein [Natrinema pallidum]ELY79895.1 gas vesicle protein GvpA [Natrinema pallidum DSM 3751]QCW02236.1 gas vesicle protein [Natrinema pallidum]